MKKYFECPTCQRQLEKRGVKSHHKAHKRAGEAAPPISQWKEVPAPAAEKPIKRKYTKHIKDVATPTTPVNFCPNCGYHVGNLVTAMSVATRLSKIQGGA